MSKTEDLQHKPFAQAALALKRELKKQQQREAEERARARLIAAAQAPAPPPRLSDAEAFAREMADVQRLPGDDRLPPTVGAAPAVARDEEAEVMAELADLIDGRAPFDLSASDEHIEGIAHGLDRRLLRKLRQGLFAVQGHIDLHGKTRVEARQSVEAFIVESRHRGRRCVLIVHGRGLNSKDQIPVLKEGLQLWLSRGRISRSVLAFCSARPTDGGVGAVYVLLRR